MAAEMPPKVWDLIDEAHELGGALKIHLTVGRPPMVRLENQGIRPLGKNHPVLTWKSIQVMLSMVVEPERWEHLEKVGEGEIRLAAAGPGRPITMTVFRNSEAWSAVIHL